MKYAKKHLLQGTGIWFRWIKDPVTDVTSWTEVQWPEDTTTEVPSIDYFRKKYLNYEFRYGDPAKSHVVLEEM